MHDCPECGQACDCDGEDTWHDDFLRCAHDCEFDPDDIDLDPLEPCTCGAVYWSIDRGEFIQVADCCCPAVF